MSRVAVEGWATYVDCTSIDAEKRMGDKVQRRGPVSNPRPRKTVERTSSDSGEIGLQALGPRHSASDGHGS